MTWVVWAALAFAFLATVTSAWFAGARFLRTWRALRSTQRIVGAGLLAVTQNAAEAEARAARSGASEERLQRALAELQESLRIASVLSHSVAEARATLSWRSLLRQ
jgi:hypothetical protein